MFEKIGCYVIFLFSVMILVTPNAFADESAIPDWIKQVAGFWSNNQISDNEFLNAIKYMIQHDIITLSDTPAIIPELNVDRDIVYVVPYGAMMHNMMMINYLDDSDHDKIVREIELWLEEGEDPNVTNCSRESPEKCMVPLLKGDGTLEDKEIEPLERIQDELDDVQFDWLIRQNNQYIGQDVFLEGVVLEVADIQDGKYEILLDVYRVNFDFDGGFAIIEYTGSRVRDGDTILVTGSVSGLDIIEISDNNTTITSNSNPNSSLSTTQMELPHLSASRIHVLVYPSIMTTQQLEQGALHISRETLKEHREILDDTLVYFEGVVTSIIKEDEEFKLNVSTDPYDISSIFVKYNDRILDGKDISRYDNVQVYGMANIETSGSDPSITAIHIDILS